jgi:hypothetical protein
MPEFCGRLTFLGHEQGGKVRRRGKTGTLRNLGHHTTSVFRPIHDYFTSLVDTVLNEVGFGAHIQMLLANLLQPYIVDTAEVGQLGNTATGIGKMRFDQVAKLGYDLFFAQAGVTKPKGSLDAFGSMAALTQALTYCFEDFGRV